MRTFFHNARLFDGENDPRDGMCVTVEGERIVGVAPDSAELRQADGDHRDLTGKTLMPGMVCGHYHAEYPDLRLAETGKRYLGLEYPPGYLTAVAIQSLGFAVESGVTGVVGAGCSQDIDVSLKMAAADGRIVAPRIRPCGQHINTTANENEPRQWWGISPPREDGILSVAAEIFADGADGMRKAVRHQLRRGVEVIKIFPSGGHGVDYPEHFRSMTMDELEAVITTAHNRGAIVRGHVTTKSMMLDAIKLGLDIVDHGDDLDDEVIDAMVKHGTFYVPSMLFLKKLLPTDEGEYARASQLAPLKRSFENVKKMLPVANKAGVKIVPGDDFGLEFMTHQPGTYAEEWEIYVDDCGIGAKDVLTWLTRNGAQMMGLGEEAGLIQPGRLADIVVVDGDPLTNFSLLRRPRETLSMVMIGGKAMIDRLPRAEGRPAVPSHAAQLTAT